ncbi:NADPH-dependent codeinone reductase 1-4 [Hibiscus syriacus]|uniref:NADPH-dependent codeinone reductase 1-4 n=1 Tax=Hibiscus syriacus TaxID=106335 RepID=A0A6A3AQC0_HIBSY|nr:D-galacturonate reductase-like [Hibiscus syriacus]KAE8705425.1 NADPH-dependent codeinone reductase 1-4 [Hibiscus syriacus]
MENKVPTVSLGGGLTMPVIGMGTASYPPADADTVKSAIVEAIGAGYRHFDTAFIYGSEQPLGEAIAEAIKIRLIKSRDELFITSKLWCTFAEQDLVIPAIKMSLENLQLEYLDLYLIHWPLKFNKDPSRFPVPKQEVSVIDTKSVWSAMEECQRLGLTKSIGVSNFSARKLDEILSSAKIPPTVNQVEINPLRQQKEMMELCKAKGIHVSAHSPLGSKGTPWGDNRIFECLVLKEVAQAKGKTTAQICLRWVYEQGASVITKSFNGERMKENLEIFDWSLSGEEMEKISGIPQRKHSSSLGSFIEDSSELEEEL